MVADRRPGNEDCDYFNLIRVKERERKLQGKRWKDEQISRSIKDDGKFPIQLRTLTPHIHFYLSSIFTL